MCLIILEIRLKAWLLFLSHNMCVCMWCCFCPPSHEAELESAARRWELTRVQVLCFGTIAAGQPNSALQYLRYLWHSNIECREQKFITYAFPLTFVKLNVKQGSVPSHLKVRKNCYFLSVLLEKRIRKMNSNFHITLIICALTAQEKFKWNQLLLWRGKRFDILSALLLLSKCEFYHRYPVAFT